VQAAVDLLFGQPFAHLWYSTWLPGSTWSPPPLRIFVAAARLVDLRYATALALAVGFAANETGYIVGLPSPLAVLLFVPFVGYYCWKLAARMVERRRGGRRGCGRRRLPSNLFLIGVAAGVTAVTAIGTGLIRQSFPDFAGWKILCDQLSPTVMVAAVAVYLTAPAIERGRGTGATVLKRAGAWVAPYALGIYIVHPLAMLAISEWAGLSPRGWGRPPGAGGVRGRVLFKPWPVPGAGAGPGMRMVIGIGARD